jgi:hypothetical protein
VWVVRAYLATARGRASLALAVAAMSIAFTVLEVAVGQPAGPDPGAYVLFGLTLLVAGPAFGVGAMDVLRDRRADIATLRALGWTKRTLQLRILISSASIGLLVGGAALLLSFVAQLAGGGSAAARPPGAGWIVASGAGSFGMVVMSSWWPAHRVVRYSVIRGRRGRGAARGVVKGAVIAGAGMALSLEMAVRWAWQSHPVASQDGTVDWIAVAIIAVLATATVGDLDWLAARERAGESRTLRAMGWPARGLAWRAAREAALLGSAAGLVAGALDVVGCLTVAHRMPHRMLWVVLITVVAGVAISVAAQGTSVLAPRLGGAPRPAGRKLSRIP